MWLMPLLVFLFAVVEYIMFRLYNKLGHPWKVILDDFLEVVYITMEKLQLIFPNDVKDGGWT